ncbi:MAG: transporter substrate-binding domain-containing protein [Campylobacteraceae bacterium]|nr:transporter substrate-binding domain-containing protein [Campylobacteraceae bacterium]
MRKILFFLSFTIFLFANENKLFLNDEELNWIKNNPVVKVGAKEKWAPFSMYVRGRHEGLSSDYLKIISRKTGLKFNYIFDSWNNLEEKIIASEIDIIPAAYFDEKIKKHVYFSSPYLSIIDYFFVHKSIKALDFSDLKGLTLALPKGYFRIDLIKKEMPYLEIMETKNLSSAISAVLERKADILFGSYSALSHLMRKHSILEIVPFKENPFNSGSDLHIITSKKKPILASIIEKTLKSISEVSKKKIYNNWLIDRTDLEHKLRLSNIEKEWLSNHPVLNFAGDPNWFPFEAYDSRGEYIGVVSEYLNEITKATGLKFNHVITDSWNGTLDLLKKNEIDILSDTTDAKRENYIFTKSYMEKDIIILMNNKQGFIQGLDSIKDKKIALIYEYGYIEKIKDAYPYISFVTVNTIEEALLDIENGRIDALVSTLPVAAYYITKNGLNNIKIVGKTEFTTKLGFGIRKELLPLVGILNKIIDSIPSQKKFKIMENWVNIDYVEKINYRLFIIIIIVLFLILIWFLNVNNRMNTEIKLRIELEHNLKLSQKEAERANKSKSDFLTNMSHEIRTPLHAVLGFTELLEKTSLNPAQKSYLSSISSSGENLLKLINEILDLSKIESEKLHIEKKPVDINKLLNEIYKMFLLQAQAKKLDFDLTFSNNIPKLILSDEQRIKQIIINLLANAIKFTEKGFVQIGVETKRDKHNNLSLLIHVQDSGIGIPKKNQGLIFKQFEQQKGQDDLKYGGSGLGLAISKKLSYKLGGFIKLESKKNSGSRFTLCLENINCVERSPKKEKSSLEYIFSPAHILVVDDVFYNRELIKGMLQDQALKITEAKNGAEALQCLEDNEIDLILMDIRMPLMDGFEATKCIRNNPKYKSLPILAITASVLYTEKEMQENYGFDKLLTKPVLHSTLIDNLNLYLKSSIIDTDNTVKEVNNTMSEALRIKYKESFLDVVCEQENKNNFSQLKKLALDISNFSKENKSEILLGLSQKLKDAVSSFDIDMIEISLNELKTLSIKRKKDENFNS